MSIPASDLVSVIPSVIGAGGSALDLFGLMLTNGTRVPIGTVQTFSNASDVEDYFGASTTEANLADIYFNGFDGSNVKPGRLLFAQYNEAAVAGYIRGGDISGLTLTELQAIPSGTLTLTIDGVTASTGSISLAAASSFSNAAALISTALAAAFTPDPVCTYDSTSGGFVITSATTGATSLVSLSTGGVGTLGANLLLTAATGAVRSIGAAAVTDPGAFMDALILVNHNWATFMTTFDPDGPHATTDKFTFAEWTNSEADRYAYAAWDIETDAPLTVPSTTSLGYLIQQADLSGSCVLWGDTNANAMNLAALILGYGASIDFTQTNGRVTAAFRQQGGIEATVLTQTAADNLRDNGYNFYGDWSTANDDFKGVSPGSVSGPFQWLDSYYDQIWLNNSFQLALMNLLFTAKSIPYNEAGRAMIQAACQDTINAGLNFGVFRPGVALSEAQKSEVNTAAGGVIDDVLSSRGWYLQVGVASAQTRQARQSPPCTFWYVDGQSVQKITLNSVEIQ